MMEKIYLFLDQITGQYNDIFDVMFFLMCALMFTVCIIGIISEGKKGRIIKAICLAIFFTIVRSLVSLPTTFKAYYNKFSK